MLVAVGNGPSFGGGLRITEGALLDDGMLDVVIIKPMTKPDLIRTYPKLFKGTHIHHPQYEHHRVRDGHRRRSRHRRPTPTASASARCRSPIDLRSRRPHGDRMSTPSEQYADFRRGQEHPVFTELRRALRLRARRLPGPGLPRGRGGPRRARRRAHRLRQDHRRRVRRAPGHGDRPQVLLHDADQGAEQPEVPGPGPALRAGERRPAHRRQHHQRRGADRGDDHRGAPQHAVRRVPDADGPRVRRDGRGALPRRPDARRGLGGGDHPPARERGGDLPERDRLQRRGVRRVAGRGARRHHHDRGGGPPGPAVPARDGRQAAARPLRRRGGPGPGRLRPGGRQGQPAAAQGGPRRLRDQPAQGPAGQEGAARPRPATPGPPRCTCPAASTSSPASTPRGCCPRSSSSSAGSAATPRSPSACRPTCG